VQWPDCSEVPIGVEKRVAACAKRGLFFSELSGYKAIRSIIGRAANRAALEQQDKGWNVMRSRVAALAAATFGLIACGPASAGWPEDKPIEVVIGFAPGGGTDVMARKLLPFVEQRLGGKAKFVVLNKPGAGRRDRICPDRPRRPGCLFDRRRQRARLQFHPDDAQDPVQHG
jgi:hypothetical protein